MAIKISDLPIASSITDSDNLIIDNGTATQRISSKGFVSQISDIATQAITEEKTARENADTELKNYIDTSLVKKQDKLVSGTNIKTVNSVSLLGDGDISTPSTEVIDNLTSESTTSALSANQGKILKSSVDTHTQNISNLENTSATLTNNINNLASQVEDLDSAKLSAGADVIGTLSAGSTSITLTLPSTYKTTNLMLDVYTSIYGVVPNTMTTALTSTVKVTMTFNAQSVAMTVGIKVMGTY